MILQSLKIREKHLEQIRLWRMSEDTTKYLFTDTESTPEDQKRWYQQIMRDLSRMDWVINVDGKNVGFGCLYDIDPLNRRCFWGYYIGEQAARGRGIGKAWTFNILAYAFTQLNLHKLCGETFEWNDASIKIHERHGAKIEGVFRQHVWKRGEYHNVIRMGILRREWEQEVRGKFQYPPAEIEEWEDKKHHVLKEEEVYAASLSLDRGTRKV